MFSERGKQRNTTEREGRTMKCVIKWTDGNGNATPDSNDATQMARCKDRTTEIGGRMIHVSASEWLPICAEHSSRFNDAGMQIWETAPLPPIGINPTTDI
jgi:hypothetical protein